MTAKSDRIKLTVNDPVIKEAFNEVREHYRDAIEKTPLSDPGLLTDIRKMLHLLSEVEHSLQTAIEHGELEDFRAQEQQRGILGDLKWLRRK